MEGPYYREQHKVMYDTQDGPQEIVAMCDTESDAQNIVEAMNVRHHGEILGIDWDKLIKEDE
jgi:hypothetical protein